MQKCLRKFSRKRKFSRNEISRNFAKITSFSHDFRFRKNEKTRFRFNPTVCRMALCCLGYVDKNIILYLVFVKRTPSVQNSTYFSGVLFFPLWHV
jgi:hypothetical protein